MKFEGKTLLILGTNVGSVDMVKYARSEGAYVIVTDYLPTEKSEAKQYANETAMISTTDIEALIEFGREKHIDGVFCGVSEVNLLSVNAVANALGLPCYFTREQWDVLQNKLKFKELCRANGVPVVKEYKVSPEPTREELDRVVYPVMVKPADSSGARGCRPCRNEEELLRGISDALSYSKAGQVIVEKYMDRRFCDDVDFRYIFAGGDAYPSFVYDRYVNMEQKGFAPVTSALICPSPYTENFISEVDKPLRRMFASLGIKEGVAFIQSFRDEEGFHVYEMGFRFCGGQFQIPDLSEFGVDEIRAMLNFALTGESFCSESVENITPHPFNHYCNLHFLCSEGTISRIDGLEEVRNDPSVINITQMHSVGDFIAGNGTLEQVLFRVYVKAQTRDALMDKIRELRTKIVAYDENDKPMMLSALNPDDIGTGKC